MYIGLRYVVTLVTTLSIIISLVEINFMVLSFFIFGGSFFFYLLLLRSNYDRRLELYFGDLFFVFRMFFRYLQQPEYGGGLQAILIREEVGERNIYAV